MSSVLSGKVLVAGGWDAINIVVLPVVALLLVVLVIRMLSGTAARRAAEAAPQAQGPQMPPT